MSKPLKISEQAAVQMPMKTVASLILLVAAGVFAYTELTARLVSLETSRELMKADLLKASDQKPVDQEQFMLLESLFSDVEKLIENQEQNVTNKVNIEFNKQLLEKVWRTEKLKDKAEKTEMVETVVALLLLINGEIKEARIQNYVRMFKRVSFS